MYLPADKKIMLLINFVSTAITRLSASSLVNVSLAKMNMEKEFCPEGPNGLPEMT